MYKNAIEVTNILSNLYYFSEKNLVIKPKPDNIKENIDRSDFI